MAGETSPQIISASGAIPSLLVPLLGQRLLLPTVSVAEMLPYQKLQMCDVDVASLPSWFLGMVRWRGVLIPMVSYEAMNGDDIAPIKGVSQMAVLNSTGVNSAMPFFCFPTQGIPRLSRVNKESVKENTVPPLQTYDEMHVFLDEDEVTIPDVSKMEEALMEVVK